VRQSKQAGGFKELASHVGKSIDTDTSYFIKETNMNRSIDIKVKDIEPMMVAYINVVGHFSQIPVAFEKLYQWIARKDYKPVGPAVAVYYNIPGQVPDDQLNWELRSRLSGDVAEVEPDADGLGVKRLGAIKAATTLYKGPYENVEPVHETLNAWITTNNYEICGPVEELYLNDATQTPGAEPLTEIRFPVRQRTAG